MVWESFSKLQHIYLKPVSGLGVGNDINTADGVLFCHRECVGKDETDLRQMQLCRSVTRKDISAVHWRLQLQIKESRDAFPLSVN